MIVNSYTLNPEELTAHLNDAKDLMLDTLVKENKITIDDFDKYSKEYAVILVHPNGFLNFCKDLFKVKEDKVVSKMIMVKRT